MSTKSHEPIIAKYLPQIQKMCLLDEAFMLAVFDNNIEGAEAALKIITEKSDLKVSQVISKRETDYAALRVWRFTPRTPLAALITL